MLNEFLTFIKTNRLFKSTDTVLLAVSGGVDSVVMAHLFSKANFKFGIAHCNFNLRGDEAKKDAEFVKGLAEKLNVPFFITSFETKKYAKENGISTQLAARNLRYEWFEQILVENSFKFIATAHHLNDSIETVLYNLAKGTGISGLTGIPIKNANVIRPLLFAAREEIELYASDNALTWRQDATNQESDYSRNFIRHEVVPKLKKINPSLEETFKATLQRLQSTKQVLEQQVDSVRALCNDTGDDIFINKSTLQQLEIATLSAFLKPFGFNFAQCLDVKSTLSEVGKVFKSESHTLNIDRSDVIISKSSAANVIAKEIQDDQLAFENQLFSMQLKKSSGGRISNDWDASFDYDKLSFPLLVRKWEPGDSFRPLGMKGEKKLSDFMIDNKIPLNLKERVFVLVSENSIVWVIGHRIDDRFKITDTTKNTLNIRLHRK